MSTLAAASSSGSVRAPGPGPRPLNLRTPVTTNDPAAVPPALVNAELKALQADSAQTSNSRASPAASMSALGPISPPNQRYVSKSGDSKLSQFKFNYELTCPEILDHLAHNNQIDLLVTRVSKEEGRVHLIFSDNMCLFAGTFIQTRELGSIDEDDVATMDDPKFIKLHVLANRIDGISKHLKADFTAKDEDMGDAELQFWRAQAEGLSLEPADMTFFKHNSALLLLVLQITSRTKLTLTTLKKKLAKPSKWATKPLYGVSLKLMTIVDIGLPYAQSTIRMVGQLQHDVGVRTVDPDGKDVETTVDANELLNESAASHSLAKDDADAMTGKMAAINLASSGLTTPAKPTGSTLLGISPMAPSPAGK